MHPLNELATLAEVLGQFACGEMEGCSSFVYPIHLQGQPHDCYVALNSSGPFQTVFASAKVGEILPFGKYIKFVITPPDRPAVQEGLQARDAFRMMMEVQQHLSVLNKVCNERTGKDRLRNTIIDLLDRKRVGWTAAYVQTTGNRFVELLTDVLWYLDGHTATLEGRRLSVPGLFSDLTGFNKPESHGHTRAPMEASKLCTYSGALFRTTEEPRLGKSNWSEFNVATKALATNLSSYCSYLYQQREKVTKHHQSLVPIRAPTEAQSFMVISPQACTSPVHTERYKTLNCALEETEEFVPIFLNDLCPLEPRQRRYYLDNLPQAAAAHSVMFSHAYSNNLGTLHFIWRVPEGISASDLLERNMKSADLVKERRDVYHTRAMRKEATHIFGSICGIKPAFLREIYKRLTGDASASRTSNEAAVDDRIRLVLDCVDPSVVYDLRQLNEGRPEQYMKFWEECERYLESVTELAVHERRHGEVTYLAAALSASDLLSEVAKRCPEGTPIPSEAWLRYQIWPKDPSKMVASQYTGRLKVKHMVQARQFRKFHPDAHYASALYRYLRCFAVNYSTFSTFASLDNKHHCKVGEPNHPVAAVERGKAVLVSLGKTFTVSDHDFTRFSLIPSVVLLVDIPASPEESFHQGQVCIGLKDLALEPSSALRHATEFSKVLSSCGCDDKPILCLYTDG